MNVYLVDFENVNTRGLKGIERLKAKDKVIVLYSHNAGTIRCDMMNELLRSQVSVEFLEVTQLGQNGLDFQLSALLGCLIGGFRGTCLNIYIISKDTGFDVLQDGVHSLLKQSVQCFTNTLSFQLHIQRMSSLSEEIEETSDGKTAVEKIKGQTTSSQSEYRRRLLDSSLCVQIKVLGLNDKKSMIQEINKRVTCKADYRKELRSRLGATEGERIYTMLTPDLDRTFALFEKRAGKH